MAQSKHWKRTERKTAKALGTRRTPLSGENSGHGGGDVILQNVNGVDYDLLVEVKHYQKFFHHSLFRDAQADAKKHGITPGHTILVTKLKGERGELVTIDASTFYNEIFPIWKSQLVKSKEAPNEATSSTDTSATHHANPLRDDTLDPAPAPDGGPLDSDPHSFPTQLPPSLLENRKRRRKLLHS